MSKSLLLFPFGGNARESLMSVFAVNERREEWNILGFIDDDHSSHGKDCCGIKVLGGREILKEMPDAFVLAVPGSPKSYSKRKRIIESLHIEKTRFATIIHPSVVASPDSKIGYNTLIMPNVFISCGVEIGNHCIVLSNTIIAHDSVISDYCCVGSNVTVSGNVSIGANCYLGSGTSIREGVRIGKRSLVGLGSNIISDFGEDLILVGNPARIIRKNSS